jgi:hypothetical protein
MAGDADMDRRSVEDSGWMRERRGPVDYCTYGQAIYITRQGGASGVIYIARVRRHDG